MPNVRASSGMIGTTRWPRSLFFKSVFRIDTKAIVVETGRPPDPFSDSANSVSSGTAR